MRRHKPLAASRVLPDVFRRKHDKCRDNNGQADHLQPEAPFSPFVIVGSSRFQPAQKTNRIFLDRERQGLIVAVENVPGVQGVHHHLVWIEPISGMAFPSSEDENKQHAAS